MKITMYELLGLIKDGKAPKKIKYEDRTYTLYLDEENNRYYQDDKCKYFMLSISCFEELNDEVEILEEEKKIPEKLEKNHIIGGIVDNKTYYEEKYNIEDIGDKVNEIIDYLDYLKSKGE